MSAKTRAGTPNRSVVASHPAGLIAGVEYTLVSVAELKTQAKKKNFATWKGTYVALSHYPFFRGLRGRKKWKSMSERLGKIVRGGSGGDARRSIVRAPDQAARAGASISVVRCQV